MDDTFPTLWLHEAVGLTGPGRWQALEAGVPDRRYAPADPFDAVAAGGATAALPAPGPGDWQALRLHLRLAGAAAGAAATVHYVVETDVPPEREEEFHAWYDTEHLPGLAAVPGTIAAARWRRLEPGAGRPRWIAGYLLTDAAVMGSPPWLAVRGTAWAARVRPWFQGTRRLMFRA